MEAKIWIGPDDRIWAEIPYAEGNGPAYAKRVAGVRPKYEKSTTPGRKDKFLAWTYPKEMTTCRLLRDVFGAGLRIHPELIAWAKVAVKEEERMIALAKSTGVGLEFKHLPYIAWDLNTAISNRPYQKAGAQFILDGKTTLVADQPGLGKTLETLAALVESGAKQVIILTPRTTMQSVWAREIERWTRADVFLAVGTPRQRQAAIDAAMAPRPKAFDIQRRILICNPEMIRAKRTIECPDDCGGDYDCEVKSKHKSHIDAKYQSLFDCEWDAVVVDECHKTLIGKNVMSKNVTQTRLGMMSLKPKKGGLKVALSGTPYRGKPELLWGVMNWLRPDVFTSFWRWADSYFEIHVDPAFGGRTIGAMIPERKDAYDQMLAPYILRRTKGEVAKDLPPKMYGGTPLDPAFPDEAIAVWLEMEPAQQKLYDQMFNEAEATLDGGTLDAIGVLAERTRLQQFAICTWDFAPELGADMSIVPKPLPSNKYDWLLQFVSERVDDGTKVVVASQYTKVINSFAAQMDRDGIPSYVLTGETKMDRRAEIVAEFQDDPDSHKVFFINTMAGGVGITLDAADDLVFLDETSIPDDQEQVEDRIHRVSRIHNVTIWKLMSLGSIEEAIALVNEGRESAIKERLDGSRGVAYAKILLGSS